MHSLLNSLSKRLYTHRVSNSSCVREWSGRYWQETEGIRVIACEKCRKFEPSSAECSIPFGTPLRKCVTAAQEANLHSLVGRDLLEIGFGKHSIPRRLVKAAGGTWTGIEPTLPVSRKAVFGKGCHGYVADIPFPENTFDIVTGIQTIEHWAQKAPDPTTEEEHWRGLREVIRVLKPNGLIYFCAPIYLHGHEMFVTGDIPRIRALFEDLPVKDIVIEKWREDYLPLERYPTPESDLKSWRGTIKSYPQELLDDIRQNRSVALITIKAVKLGPPSITRNDSNVIVGASSSSARY